MNASTEPYPPHPKKAQKKQRSLLTFERSKVQITLKVFYLTDFYLTVLLKISFQSKTFSKFVHSQMCFTDKLHCSQIFTAQLESPKNDPTFSERCRAQRRACEAKPDWTRLAWRVLREKRMRRNVIKF